MVTGAGGSIGSELCRQIIKNKPTKLIIYELTEFALYSIDKELNLKSQIEIIPILGTVLDQAKLERILEQYTVQTVYHAAAYKHVPLVECNPLAGLKNNAIGTAFSLNAAVKKGVAAPHKRLKARRWRCSRFFLLRRKLPPTGWLLKVCCRSSPQACCFPHGTAYAPEPQHPRTWR